MRYLESQGRPSSGQLRPADYGGEEERGKKKKKSFFFLLMMCLGLFLWE